MIVSLFIILGEVIWLIAIGVQSVLHGLAVLINKLIR